MVYTNIIDMLIKQLLLITILKYLYILALDIVKLIY